MKKSERAGPHPIGQNGKLVKRSLGPKSQVPDPQSQIPGPRSRIRRKKFRKKKIEVGKKKCIFIYFVYLEI